MEVQNVEFTVERLLDLHRYWITELFIVDKKSEEEILHMLHNHQINVTPATLHAYLLNWNLLTPRPYDPVSWTIVPNADQLLSIQENDDYGDDYFTVSATSLQSVTPAYKSSSSSPFVGIPSATAPKSVTTLDAPITTSIPDKYLPGLTLPPSQPVLKGFDAIPNRLTPIEFYSLDLQDHRRSAVDLEIPRVFWRRMKEKRKGELESSSTKRTKRGVTVRSRKAEKK
ncbi:hypothetical protein DSL72_003898 [Monilinia vaccinii-corymbosi]|uniref:Clr5 domain-containing protein n=1 Tax=Monilinia vaccinii-corymbosi TaxID=61207 RepID=A0A8A3P0U5_9HELO|nr:hypothetical protein DSL72_003898 [Monilinia vaccinii-corymbosi]